MDKTTTIMLTKIVAASLAYLGGILIGKEMSDPDMYYFAAGVLVNMAALIMTFIIYKSPPEDDE